MQEIIENNDSGIIIENRKTVNISGVLECLGFDEQTILIETKQGKLAIKGNNLRITGFNTETGDFSATGKISAVGYLGDGANKSFFGKIFR